MGKKSKRAKARKAIKEKSRAITICQGLSDRWDQVERWRVGSCAHGVNNTNALIEGSVCRSFVDKFLDVLEDEMEGRKFEKTGEVFVNALEKTYESHREQVWDDDTGKIY